MCVAQQLLTLAIAAAASVANAAVAASQMFRWRLRCRSRCGMTFDFATVAATAAATAAGAGAGGIDAALSAFRQIAAAATVVPSLSHLAAAMHCGSNCRHCCTAPHLSIAAACGCTLPQLPALAAATATAAAAAVNHAVSRSSAAQHGTCGLHSTAFAELVDVQWIPCHLAHYVPSTREVHMWNRTWVLSCMMGFRCDRGSSCAAARKVASDLSGMRNCSSPAPRTHD